MLTQKHQSFHVLPIKILRSYYPYKHTLSASQIRTDNNALMHTYNVLYHHDIV